MYNLYRNYIQRCVCRLLYVLTFVLGDFADNAENRPPYDAEVDAEVTKEYQRLQDEKRKVRPDHGRDIDCVRTWMSYL